MLKKILVTIPTTRLQESLDFYTGILDFSIKNRIEIPGGTVLVFLENDGFTVELVAGPHIAGGEIGPGAPLLTFLVSDFKEINQRLLSAGQPLPKPIQLGGGTEMMRFKDPNGVVISFVVENF